MHKCRSIAKGDLIAEEYHDNRWCKPCHDDKELFAMLCLEGQQAGLSWTTILHKEKAIRKAFSDFNIDIVANYSENEIEKLMNTPDIIKNRAKIKSAIKNANAIKKLISSGEFKSFDEYVWHFTNGQQIIHHPKDFNEIPAKNELSEIVSKDLKKRGCSFVGPVIIYSFLQGIGVFDDHLDGCPYKNH